MSNSPPKPPGGSAAEEKGNNGNNGGERLACPRCDRTITRTALRCAHCNLELKAHGHPGIDLYRAKENETPLCATCAYEADNSCNFPKRPNAMSCTLYQDIHKPRELTRKDVYTIPAWRKNSLRLALFILVVLSLLVISL